MRFKWLPLFCWNVCVDLYMYITCIKCSKFLAQLKAVVENHKGPADRASAAKIFPLGLLLSGYLSEP
jgi:hypothetical protein